MQESGKYSALSFGNLRSNRQLKEARNDSYILGFMSYNNTLSKLKDIEPN